MPSENFDSLVLEVIKNLDLDSYSKLGVIHPIRTPDPLPLFPIINPLYKHIKYILPVKGSL